MAKGSQASEELRVLRHAQKPSGRGPEGHINKGGFQKISPYNKDHSDIGVYFGAPSLQNHSHTEDPADDGGRNGMSLQARFVSRSSG